VNFADGGVGVPEESVTQPQTDYFIVPRRWAETAACRDAQLHDFIVSLPRGRARKATNRHGYRVKKARRLAMRVRSCLTRRRSRYSMSVAGGDDAYVGRSVLLITRRVSPLTALADEVRVIDEGF
jgi:hypothetical protein